MSTIPKHAQRVYEGILHDIYHWEQPAFDGSVLIFEGIKRKPSVTVIAITENGQFIVNHEEQPYNGACICLPGGIAESEDLKKEAMRELEEETGYISSDWHFFTKIDILNYSKMEWESHFFIANNCKKSGQVQLDVGEKIAIQLYSFDDFVALTQTKDFSIQYISDLFAELLKNPLELNKFKTDILHLP